MKIIDTILIPCDWMQINVWTETDPNLIGEALRYWSFIGRAGETGCYSTFKLPEFLKEVNEGEYYKKAGLALYNKEEKYQCFVYEQKEGNDEYFHWEAIVLVVAWQWDGDGCLYFRLKSKENDIEVVNTDCKKDYEWKFVNEEKL